MQTLIRIGLAVSLCAALAACGDSSSTPPATKVQALFEVPRGTTPTSSYYALPFPNELRVGTDGRIDLSNHARPNAITQLYIDAVAESQRGFSLNAPAFFRFSAAMDASTLPQTPEASRMADASVYLVNVHAGSPNYGTRWPLKFRFETKAGLAIGTNWLAVLPYPGFPLEEETTYAVIVTNRFRPADGEIEPSADFLAMREGSPEDADLAAAATKFQPLWDYLDQPGEDERADVVSATVFTTQNATGLLTKVREVIHRDAPAPMPRMISETESRSEYKLYEGMYDAPIFQQGTIPYSRPEDGGEIVVDGNGEPTLQEMVTLRFALSIPNLPQPPNGWPIVIYGHGTGGSYRTFYNNGNGLQLAVAGVAVISIDQTLHGPRNPGGDPELDYFNFLNPLSARDNTLQGALDYFQLIRLITDFNQTLGSETVTFDTSKVYYFGHSQGGLTGVPFVSVEPMIKGAVFSGSGGMIIESLLHKIAPIDIAALVKLLVTDNPLDEFNPILGLVQGYFDRADPVNFAPYITARPKDGRDPTHVFVTLGLIDTFTPVPAIKALATALEVDLVGPVLEPMKGLELLGAATLTAPAAGNKNGVTAAVAQYEQFPGSDGHFVVLDVAAASKQSIQFLATLATDGVASVVAP